MHELLLPRLTETMEEGTVVGWLVPDGAAVRRGDTVVEIETDKASMACEAEADGTLQIIIAAGKTVPVGTPIARLLEAGEVSAPPAAMPNGVDAPSEQNGSRGSPPRERVAVRATPVARRAARDHGIDLREVDGTGPRGRIRREDVERAVSARQDTEDAAAEEPVSTAAPESPATPGPVPAASGTPSAKGETTVELPTRAQATIARRMAEAKATIPDFSVTVDAEVGELLMLRDALKRDGVPTPSVNDFVVKAAALALREHPRVNGCFRDAKFELYSRVNVGIAVAVDDALLVPTIYDADCKPLAQIARESRTLADRAREGIITPPELASGTFTVSNLGMFGVRCFTPIVNPGQAAILAVGASRTSFVPGQDGEPVTREMCELTLVSDHRILYGTDAARFTARVADLLAKPLALLWGAGERF